MAPRYLGGERKDGREQSAQRAENFMHEQLCRAPPRRIRRVAVHPILRNIDIEAAQIDGAKLVECVINLMELERLVSRSTIANHLVKPLQNPAINQCCSCGR